MISRAYMMLIVSGILMLLSCKKQVSYEKNMNSDAGHVSGKSLNQVSAVSPNEKKVDGRFLQVSIQKLEELKLRGHTGLEIYVESDKRNDYFSYIICNPSAKSCDPAPDAPGEFVWSGHQHLSPPDGLVTVEVQACVRPARALNPASLCGPVARKSIQLSPSEDPEMKKLLDELALLRRAEAEDCHDFFQNSKLYYDQIKDNPKLSEAELVKSVRKQIEQGEDLSCALIRSAAVQDLKKGLDNVASDGDGKDKNKKSISPGAVALMSVGAVSALIGVAYLIKSYGMPGKINVPGNAAKSVRIRLSDAESLSNQAGVKDALRSVSDNAEYLESRLGSDGSDPDFMAVKRLSDLYQLFGKKFEEHQKLIRAQTEKIETLISSGVK